MLRKFIGKRLTNSSSQFPTSRFLTKPVATAYTFSNSGTAESQNSHNPQWEAKYGKMLDACCKKYEFNTQDPFPLFEISYTFKFFLWIVNFQLLGLSGALAYVFYIMAKGESLDSVEFDTEEGQEKAQAGNAKETGQKVYSSEDGKTKVKIGAPTKEISTKIMGIEKEFIPYLFIPPFLLIAMKKNLKFRK